MVQPGSPDDGPEDVLSMGEGRSPRWGPLLAVLVVVLLGLGAYRLVSGPSTPTAPPPAAAAQEEPSPAVAGSLTVTVDESAVQGPSLRLGRHLVTLRGPEVTQAHRETSATALQRIRHGWLVRLTSRACQGRADIRTSYGVARASGLFTAWKESSTARRPTWRSPDGGLVLVEDGSAVRVRRTGTSMLLAEFKAAG